MSTGFAVGIFLLGLAVSVVSSAVLAQRIDQVGARLHLSEGLLGIITAPGADAPEIASAVTALVGGQHDLGMGVVLGSNLFNLAALLGLSAVVAGQVRVGRAGLWFDGGAALAVTLIVGALVAGWLSAVVAGVLLAAVMIPYVLLSALRPPQIDRLHLPGPVGRFLGQALGEAHHNAKKDQTPRKLNWIDGVDLVPALVAVVVASVAMVRTSVALGNRWGVPQSVVGTLVLASLTGIPNVVAAIRLARHHRGSAVVSESLNSNSLNLLVGAFLPAALLGAFSFSHASALAMVWLIGLTIVALALASFRGGLRRAGGFVVIAGYAAFVCVTLLWG